jgi:hypothetical protein
MIALITNGNLYVGTEIIAAGFRSQPNQLFETRSRETFFQVQMKG